jgi:hypothetical protein
MWLIYLWFLQMLTLDAAEPCIEWVTVGSGIFVPSFAANCRSPASSLPVHHPHRCQQLPGIGTDCDARFIDIVLFVGETVDRLVEVTAVLGHLFRPCLVAVLDREPLRLACP